jgi:hypothetical protein
MGNRSSGSTARSRALERHQLAHHRRPQGQRPTLESCITDRWTKQAENVVSFDSVVIAKRYIGPVARK